MVRCNSTLDDKNALLPEREMRAHNARYAGRLKNLAWLIEIVLVTAGLGIALAQTQDAWATAGFVQSFPVFAVFLILAIVELAKIPATTVIFHARGIVRVLALLGLLVAAGISFETVFNGFERFVHHTTQKVSDARAELQEIESEIARLQSTSFESEISGEAIEEADKKQRDLLEQRVSSAEAAVSAASQNLESSKTKDLRLQLNRVLQQQNDAGRIAGDEWQKEQEWIMQRLESEAIDSRTRGQLNARMRSMPAKQNVVAAARAEFDDTVKNLNAEIEASIQAPSEQALKIVAARQAERDRAMEALAAFDKEARARERSRTEALINLQADKAKRAALIEELEANAVQAERALSAAANGSQMHRWASAVFKINPEEVQDHQAKTVGTAFGVFLGVVAALTGSSVAMYAEWFRMRGVAPVVVKEEVPVEVIVEKEVEKPVEVEVPTTVYKYVPVPIGDDPSDTIAAILDILPDEAAESLKSQLPDGFGIFKGDSPNRKVSNDDSKHTVSGSNSASSGPNESKTKDAGGSYARAA